MEELISHLNSALYLIECVGAFWIAKQLFKAAFWLITNFDVIYKKEDKDEFEK